MPVQNIRAQEDGLTGLSLEALMNIEVTLASRKEERLFETAAAIFVLTQDEIRRSGVTSVPEALRLVPGMQVARVDANKWAISARGFNSRFAQKLLVLIDGRTVYTPIFSGVFWDIQDLMLEDVDRIEVIRGPGATLWGANAVNGIVNVITKNSQDTQGLYVKGGVGTEERGFGMLRYGGQANNGAHFRIYGKYFNRDASVNATGQKQADDWFQYRAGIRGDWAMASHHTFMVQGGLYDGKTGQTFGVPLVMEPLESTFDDETNLSGGHALARWDYAFSPSSEMTLQTYYDRNRRKDTINFMRYETFDVDFQHQFAIGQKQNVVWGMGYRTNRDTTHGTAKIIFDPQARTTNLFGAFVQNEISIVDNQLWLTLGLKAEHNSFTGLEYQPNTRMMWIPHERHAFWGGISRAVRTPARSDTDIIINFKTFRIEDIDPTVPLGGRPVLARFIGNEDFTSEKLIAYELGYRMQPTPTFFGDASVFYNSYSDLRGLRIKSLTFVQNPPHFVNTIVIDNLKDAKTWGLELVLDWHWWENLVRLRTVYSYLNVDLNLKAGVDPSTPAVEVGSPKHQAYAHLSLTPHRQVQLDGVLRFVGRLPDHVDDTIPVSNLLPPIAVDRYTELDVRLSVRVSPAVEFAIVGQNLIQAHHPETEDYFLGTLSTQFQRGVYGSLSCSF